MDRFCTLIMGDRHRTVGRAVVDNDRLDAGSHAGKHPDKALGLIETRQDDLDLGRVIDHAHDASAARLRLTLADRFRLAYAADYAARRCSRRTPRCLG